MNAFVGQDTGFADNGMTPIRVGDRMTVPRHNAPCCEHWVTCTIRWNDEWQAYGMQADDGEWISGMGIAGGYAVMSNTELNGSVRSSESLAKEDA